MFKDDIQQSVLAIDNNPLLANGISMLLSQEEWLEAHYLPLTADWKTLEGRKRDDLPCLPTIVILDPTQFDLDVATIVGRLNKIIGRAPVYIAYSDNPGQDLIDNFFNVGFRGIISKQLHLEAVKIAVASVCHGLIHIEETVAREIFARGRGGCWSAATGSAAPGRSALVDIEEEQNAFDSIDKLTDRETVVLQAIALGKSMKEIAHELDLSAKTIETYKARAATKLNLKSRSQIVDFAMRAGLV